MDDPWLHDIDFLKIIDVLLHVIFAGIYNKSFVQRIELTFFNSKVSSIFTDSSSFLGAIGISGIIK